MDASAEKRELIEWLVNLKDEDVLDEIRSLKEKEEGDWFQALSKEEKEDIVAGIVDLENGRESLFKDVIGKYR
jgi:sensor domain CHASE-containing protein